LRVVVAGRTAERLRAAAASVCSSGGSVMVKVADASREADVTALFDEAAGENDLELVVYNVGNNFAAPALETQTKLFEDLWRQNALGGFLVGRDDLAPRFYPIMSSLLAFGLPCRAV
jgi:NAD(P)-dependent dehydrogenase (short-subunit alcohol dehydrogenase family)